MRGQPGAAQELAVTRAALPEPAATRAAVAGAIAFAAAIAAAVATPVADVIAAADAIQLADVIAAASAARSHECSRVVGSWGGFPRFPCPGSQRWLTCVDCPRF